MGKTGERITQHAIQSQETIIEKSFYDLGSAVAEEVFMNGVAQFAVFDGKKIEYFPQLSTNDGTIIKPIDNEAIRKGAVTLPESAEDCGSITQLITDIQVFIHKYLDVSENFEKFATWYILLSYMYDKLQTIPYLRALGDTGCGKTRFLDVIGNLCYKPMVVAGALTSAPIFRLIDMFKGTLIIDEADLNKKSDETEDIIKIFNNGFEKQKPVMRCNPNDVTELNFFDTYCPKILATRQQFQDAATESRCLTEVMTSTNRKNIPTNLLKPFFDEQKTLRNKLLWFRLTNYLTFKQDKLMLEEMDIEPRLKQAFESFACLFAAIPDVLDSFKYFLIKYQETLIADRAETFDGQIVNNIIELIDSGQEEITPKEVAKLLGDDVKPHQVSRRLKSLNLSIKVIWRDGKSKRIINYDIEYINKLRKRYLTHLTHLTDHTEGIPPPVSQSIL